MVIILAAIGFGGWYFFLRKVPEGGKCIADARCQQNLKCVSGKCSSGKIGSACKTHSNCQSGLLCSKNLCSEKPDYSKYFDKIVISKIKPGTGPGPSNPETITTEFNAATDAIEVDVVGVKSTTIGPNYFELVNPTTGEVVQSTLHMATELNGQDIGSGTDLASVEPGQYDFNFYFNNELLYTTTVTIK